MGTLRSDTSAMPLLNSANETMPSLSKSNLSKASLYCIFFKASASLIYLHTACALSRVNLDCYGKVLALELNVEVVTAAPPFLKKAILGKFLMLVSMSASVTKPSLSTSIMAAY